MPWKELSIMSQRLEFVTLAMAADANIRHLCRSYGLSSATAYKWLRRFQVAGVNGLEDHSRRPHHSPSRVAPEMEEAIVKLRGQHPAWGGRKLRHRLLDLVIVRSPAPVRLPPSCVVTNYLTPKSRLSIGPFDASSVRLPMSCGRWISKATSNFQTRTLLPADHPG